MKKFIILILLVSFLFSGCDMSVDGMKNGFFSAFESSASHSNSGKEVDNTGSGLDLKLNIDSKNINSGRLIYEVSMENSGAEPILINTGNFKLGTKQEYGSGILESGTVEAFYTKVLSSWDGKLYQNMDFKQGGVLKISDDFLKSHVEGFDMFLRVNYPYKTEFVTNIELVENYGLFEIKSGKSFEQASPIQVNKVDLIPDVGENMYILEVEINDKGDRGDISKLEDKGIVLNNFDIFFGKESLRGKCEIKPETVEVSSSIDLKNFKVMDGSKLVLECPVSIVEKEGFVTQITGSFDFEYDIVDSVSVRIPKDIRVE